ncbi:EAL domain-containing protein, partial [Xanthomonas sp. Kuri4-1]
MRHRVSLGDLGVIAAVLSVLTYIAYAYDIFVTEGSTSAAGQTVELDEMLLIGATLLLGLLIFSIRRYREQKREARRRTQAEQRVRELAYQDPLTGLPNRRQFEEALQVAAASPPRAGAVHAVLMLDLNGFKQVNDVHGHDAGDAVLVVVAQRLLRALREGESVARLGGDEFVVLAQHLIGPEAASNIALRLLQGFGDPILADGVAHSLGAGIGIALLPTDAQSAEEAMRKADVALYRAKAERRPAYRFFEEQMDQLVRERERLEQALKQAIDQDRIQPYFRPSHDLRSGQVVGFEVSPHWLAGPDGSVPPERFLPIAAETGLIHLLAERLWQQACAMALSWPPQVQLAISVLPGQLQNWQLAGEILQILQHAGLPPQRLQLNIAESLVVQDVAAAKALITPLQAQGVNIALDHFGTGYSNLYHLGEFQFDKIKIDRRLVEHMEDASNAKLVRALIGLGQGLGLAVSADGIADADDRDTLLDSGVREGQSGDAAVSGPAT